MPNRIVAVIWPRFGPYHLARLEAAGGWFAQRGWRVLGLEVARADDTYAWALTEGARFFTRITVFPDASYHNLAPRQIARAVCEALDTVDPQAVGIVGWSCPEARAALRWCRQNERAGICMSASKRDDIPRPWWKEWLKGHIVRRFDAALVGGRPHVDYVGRLGIPPDRVFVGYDVVDTEHFSTAANDVRQEAERWRRELDLPERFFLTCCRLIPKKNVSGVLDAYARYRAQSEGPWDLVILGDGPLADGLKLHARGVQGVHWPGFTQIEDLPKYYGLASAFILASITEQWGLVVNEAMASGLPVLVSETVGSRYDLVEDGRNGYLFDPFNPQEIADAMCRMTELSVEERQAMGQRSREIIAHWGPERFAEGLWNAVGAAREPIRAGLVSGLVLRALTGPLMACFR